MLFAAAAIAACGAPDADTQAILQALGQRREAINHKDIDLYAQVIAEGYHVGDTTRERLVDKMTDYFRKFDTIEMKYQDTAVEHKQGRARVTQRVSISITGLEQPFVDTEVLLLQKIQGRWLITGGL